MACCSWMALMSIGTKTLYLTFLNPSLPSVTIAGNTASSSSANTTSSFNSAFGYQALTANTTGSNNSALGQFALGTNTTGSNNVAFGQAALAFNTTASNNVAVGYQAGYSLTTSEGSVYIGYRAGYAINFSGDTGNTFVGYNAGLAATNVGASTFIGRDAGSQITTGTSNTILGRFNGNQNGLDIRTSNSYVVLSDGGGVPQITARTRRSVSLKGAVPQIGTGITFPATQSASSDANTLDDYEEGSFTPSLEFNSGGPATNSGSAGRYVKIGRQVTCWIYVNVNSLGGGSGQAFVRNLPFVNINNAGVSEGATFSPNYWGNFASTVIPGGYVQNNLATILLVNTAPGTVVSTIGASSMTSSAVFYGCVTYQTN